MRQHHLVLGHQFLKSPDQEPVWTDNPDEALSFPISQLPQLLGKLPIIRYQVIETFESRHENQEEDESK